LGYRQVQAFNFVASHHFNCINTVEPSVYVSNNVSNCITFIIATALHLPGLENFLLFRHSGQYLVNARQGTMPKFLLPITKTLFTKA